MRLRNGARVCRLRRSPSLLPPHTLLAIKWNHCPQFNEFIRCFCVWRGGVRRAWCVVFLSLFGSNGKILHLMAHLTSPALSGRLYFEPMPIRKADEFEISFPIHGLSHLIYHKCLIIIIVSHICLSYYTIVIECSPKNALTYHGVSQCVVL